MPVLPTRHILLLCCSPNVSRSPSPSALHRMKTYVYITIRTTAEFRNRNFEGTTVRDQLSVPLSSFPLFPPRPPNGCHSPILEALPSRNLANSTLHQVLVYHQELVILRKIWSSSSNGANHETLSPSGDCRARSVGKSMSLLIMRQLGAFAGSPGAPMVNSLFPYPLQKLTNLEEQGIDLQSDMRVGE